MNAGLLLIRLVVGALLVGHGTQKLFGWLGGYGIEGTGQYFEGIGFRPGRTFAALAGVAETFGGLLLLLGLMQPLATILIISVMITAIGSVHLGHGWFAASNGPEVPMLYATVAAALALTGPGSYSGDAIFALLPLWTPAVNFAAIAIGLVAGFVNLAMRRPAAQPA
jgi:putative oxidoreductase